MIQQKTAWFVQYKDNREIIVVKRIICYLNPFKTTTEIYSQMASGRPLISNPVYSEQAIVV